MHQAWLVNALPENDFPLGAGRLVAVLDIPDPPQAKDREPAGETHGHGTPARIWRAVEPDRWFREGTTASASQDSKVSIPFA